MMKGVWKEAEAPDFERVFRMGARAVRRAAGEVQYLLESDKLSESDKLEYQRLLDSNMDESTFCDSLRILPMEHFFQPGNG